jgi:C4-dicarboxylate-specific signal transduction histidine kinase
MSDRILVKVERSSLRPQVTGDRIQLQQVLLNLMTNAIEAMAGVDDPAFLPELHYTG